jgi:uncharacterized OsmC-like protein
MTAETPGYLNGVAIAAIRQARDSMTEQPAAARFTWRARNRWVNGTHSVTSFDDFYGAGGEQAHRHEFTYDTDHPDLFAADDHGVTPVEFLLHALAGCLTANIASLAANRGVGLTEVNAIIEGDMDLRGILGVDRDVRNGYSAVRLAITVDGEADTEQLRSIVAQSTARSAVYDVLTNGVAIDITVNG